LETNKSAGGKVERAKPLKCGMTVWISDKLVLTGSKLGSICGWQTVIYTER